MSETATVEAVATPTAAPAPSEPQTQAPAEAPASPNRVTKSEIDAETQQRREDKTKRVDAYKATMKERRAETEKSAQPAAPSTATSKTAARAAQGESSRTPDATPAPEGEKKAQADESPKGPKPESPATPKVKETKVKAKDIAGKEIELTVTFDQAYQALLRDRMTNDDIRHLPDHRVLALGSERFLAQRERDQDYERNRQENQRRSAAGTQQATAPAPAQAATPGEPSAPPAAAAQTTGQPPAQTPSTDTAADSAEFSELEEQFGTTGATAIMKLLKKSRGTSENPEMAKLRSELQQEQSARNNMANMVIQERFDTQFDKATGDYPQLEAEGNEAVRKAVIANANAIASSGRFTDPLEASSFRTIFREALDSVLGKQKSETHARQLAQRQKQQIAGQPVASPSRETEPTAAISLKERKRMAYQKYRETGSIEEGQKVMRRQIANPSG